MYKKIFLLISLAFPLVAVCQYTGGNNDGFNSLSLARTIITDAIAFKGSSNDGFNQLSLSKTNITDAAAFKGGSSDGFHYILLNKKNITDATAFVGGAGRGDDYDMFKKCSGETVVWNGSVDYKWENPENWNCGILPNVGSTVLIPFGVPNYPRVNGNYEIKKLILNTNASITITTGIQFIINGQ